MCLHYISYTTIFWYWEVMTPLFTYRLNHWLSWQIVLFTQWKQRFKCFTDFGQNKLICTKQVYIPIECVPPVSVVIWGVCQEGEGVHPLCIHLRLHPLSRCMPGFTLPCQGVGWDQFTSTNTDSTNNMYVWCIINLLKLSNKVFRVCLPFATPAWKAPCPWAALRSVDASRCGGKICGDLFCANQLPES